jgi:hypothetical protein
MFVNNRVCNPRPSKPEIPSSSSIKARVSPYDSSFEDSPSLLRPAVCLVVFTTRKPFDTQSDTQDALKPIKAFLAKKSNRSSLATGGRLAFSKLYVVNQGKWPAAVAAADATAP